MGKVNFAKLVVIVAVMASMGCEGRPGSERKPNVVIILADDLGYGDISTYGQTLHHTPNIDALAEDGVKCAGFYAPVPYCAPSRATLLTGRVPLRHGLIKNPAPDAAAELDSIGIDENELLLGEVLQGHGYRSKLVGKWHLGHREKFLPVKHGFDEYFGILYSNDMRPVQLIENLDTILYPVDQSLLTKIYTDKAIEFITRHKNVPFYLQLSHAMPHKPLAASEAFYTPETPQDLYDDVIKELDWSVGKVIDVLKKNDILDHTILIFLSDNGPWYGGSAGGLKGMKATPWEGGIRVPFIIRYPKLLPAGVTITTPCWMPDIFPTILNMAGLDKPAVIIDGEDITRILQKKQFEHGPVFSSHNNAIVTVREGDWKLFVREPKYFVVKDRTGWKDPRGPDGTTIIAPHEQYSPVDYPGIKPEKIGEKPVLLFNLREDSCEMHDLSDNRPEIKERLMKISNEFMISLKEQKNTP